MRIKTIPEHVEDIWGEFVCADDYDEAVQEVVQELAEARHAVQTLELEVQHLKKKGNGKACKCGSDSYFLLNTYNPKGQEVECIDCNTRRVLPQFNKEELTGWEI